MIIVLINHIKRDFDCLDICIFSTQPP